MSGVKGKVKQGEKEFSFIEISSGTHRGIEITEEGSKAKDATHTFYCYHVGQDGKNHNLHDMAEYNKNQSKFYTELAQALAKKAVTQSKWPADGWEFTFMKNQVKLFHTKK